MVCLSDFKLEKLHSHIHKRIIYVGVIDLRKILHFDIQNEIMGGIFFRF